MRMLKRYPLVQAGNTKPAMTTFSDAIVLRDGDATRKEAIGRFVGDIGLVLAWLAPAALEHDVQTQDRTNRNHKTQIPRLKYWHSEHRMFTRYKGLDNGVASILSKGLR